jgi:hypothetical protein
MTFLPFTDPEQRLWVPALPPPGLARFTKTGEVSVDDWLEVALGMVDVVHESRREGGVGSDLPWAEHRQALVAWLREVGSPTWPGTSEWVEKLIHFPALVGGWDEPSVALVERFVIPEGMPFAAQDLVTVPSIAVEPPLVEEIDCGLGPGVRALVYTRGKKAGQFQSRRADPLGAQYAYAWRLEEPGEHPEEVYVYGVRVRMYGTPEIVVAAIPDLDVLATGLYRFDLEG